MVPSILPETKEKREELQTIDLIRPLWDGKSQEFYKGVDWLFYKYVELEEAYDSLKRINKTDDIILISLRLFHDLKQSVTIFAS